MAERRVTVRVSAVDNYSRTLDDYNRKVRQSGDATKQASRETRSLTSSLGGLQTAAVGAVAGLGVMQVLDFARGMQQTGQAVSIVSQSFGELSREVGGSSTVLNAMRDATGGVIDDMQLMTAANSLLLTGVAQSADDLATMTSSAIKLGAAMGQDASASIENFNAAMLNMSYERLDTLGVSAAAVRERVKELKLEGQETAEAFSQATLEQMEVSLGRLGPAAEAGATEVDKLNTKLKNLYQMASQRFSISIEVFAAVTNMAIDGSTLLNAQTTTDVVSEDFRPVVDNIYGAWYQFLSDEEQNMADIFETSLRNSMYGALSGVSLEGSGTQDMALTDWAMQFAWGNRPELMDPMGFGRGRERGVLDDTIAMNQQAAAAERERLRVQQEYEASVDRAAASYLSFLGDQQEAGEHQRTFSEYSNNSAEAWQRISGLAATAVSDFNGIPVATQAAANEAERLAQQAENALSAARDLGIEGDELTQFEAAADDARRMADEIGRAADNLSTMGARGMFGGRDDPTQAFFNDILSASGVGDETRMIATGEMSVVEQRFNEQIAPLLQGINEELGEGAAVAASKRFVDEYTRSIEEGLSENEALARATERIGYQMGEAGNVQYTGPRGYDALSVLDQFGGSMLGLGEGMGIMDLPALYQRGRMGEAEDAMRASPADQLGTEQEINTTLEERNSIVGDINARIEEGIEPMSTIAGLAADLASADPPDFSASALGLDTSEGSLQVISDKLLELSATEHVVRVIYEVETRGSLPPGGGEFVPVTGGQQ